jgi:hypothetical protein
MGVKDESALGFRSFRKLHVREVILQDITARFGGLTVPPRSSKAEGFREPTSEGENGAVDGKRTSELSNPASAIKWPEANSKRQSERSRGCKANERNSWRSSGPHDVLDVLVDVKVYTQQTRQPALNPNNDNQYISKTANCLATLGVVVALGALAKHAKIVRPLPSDCLFARGGGPSIR